MKELNALYAQMGISPAVYAYGEAAISRLRERFEAIDQVAEYNQAKVLAAFRKNRVSATCFAASTGYGYNDDGRDKLEQVYADVFHTEAALVRPHITCGTHALTIALSANLLPGDELLSPVGLPYDTLQEVIGIRPSPCSLAEYGVTYNQVDLLSDGTFDYENIAKAINSRTKMITIQRSKGYATRPTFSVKQIGELIAFCKNIKPDVVVMVDNCYGEFVEVIEPSDVGADMIVGSLIKNPGGGLASSGGYIAGKIIMQVTLILLPANVSAVFDLRPTNCLLTQRALCLQVRIQHQTGIQSGRHQDAIFIGTQFAVIRQSQQTGISTFRCRIGSRHFVVHQFGSKVHPGHTAPGAFYSQLTGSFHLNIIKLRNIHCTDCTDTEEYVSTVFSCNLFTHEIGIFAAEHSV